MENMTRQGWEGEMNFILSQQLGPLWSSEPLKKQNLSVVLIDIDNHVEPVRLDDLWNLAWHRNDRPPAKRPD